MRLFKRFLFLALLLLLVSSHPLFASEDFSDGFDNSEGIDIAGDSQPKEKAIDGLSGYFLFSSSYNYGDKRPKSGEIDYRGPSRLRATLWLEHDFKINENWKLFVSSRAFNDFIYAVNGKDKYNQNILSANENEIEVFDAYIEGELYKNLDLKFGRQIVVWGKSDNIRVTDVLNPLDLREPGMVDIKELRLPLLMTRLDFYFGDWNLNLIALHEKRFNKTPPQGSDFFRSTLLLPPEEKPQDNEFAIALNGIFSGWDVSFYFANIYNDSPRYDFSSPTLLKHDLLRMTGVATNIAFGNWLVKAEGAYFDGLRFANEPSEKGRRDILIGVEYQGFAEQSVSLEEFNSEIIGYKNSLAFAPDYAQEKSYQYALRYSADFENQTIHLVILASLFGPSGSGGGFQRISLGYDIDDSFKATGGFINYDSGSEKSFNSIGNNDRVFLEGKLSF